MLTVVLDLICFGVNMYLVAIGWMYVAVLMAVVEGLSSQGTWVGAFFTFLLYGLLPVSVLLYIMGTPLRRKARLKAEAEERASAAAMADPHHPQSQDSSKGLVGEADRSGHAPRAAQDDAVAPVRKEL